MVSAPFDIETGDYEQERHIFDMWRWINAQLAAMEAAPDFDSAYFKQSGQNIKKLIEEAIPIASFGLRFVRPMDEVFIKCLTGNQPYDATLRVEGFKRLDIKVEVTTTETEETVFARQELAEKGMVHRPARFEKVGKQKNILPSEMVDMGEQWEEWVAVALDRAVRKVDSRRYDRTTAILVRVDTWSPLPMSSRANLITQTRNRLVDRLSDVYGVYYLHRREIDEVRELS